jgi:transcriptional regulator with XRE-family HTH domain
LHLVCRLRNLREKRELSIKDMERATGISRGTLSAVERGKAVPLDEHVAPMEREYGPITSWYSPWALLALQEGDEPA